MKIRRNREGIYQNSTGSYRYNPLTETAYSYGHCFYRRIGQEIVLNEYAQSTTTARHINYHLGEYCPSLIIDVPGCSLDDDDWLKQAIEWYTGEFTRASIGHVDAQHPSTRAKYKRRMDKAKAMVNLLQGFGDE